jgi:hypothetical protein
MAKKPKDQDQYHLNEDVKANEAREKMMARPEWFDVPIVPKIDTTVAPRPGRFTQIVSDTAMVDVDRSNVDIWQEQLQKYMLSNGPGVVSNPYSNSANIRSSDYRRFPPSIEDRNEAWELVFKDLDVGDLLARLDATLETEQYVYDSGEQLVVVPNEVAAAFKKLLETIVNYRSAPPKIRRLSVDQMREVMMKTNDALNHPAPPMVAELERLAPNGTPPYVARIVVAALLGAGVAPRF